MNWTTSRLLWGLLLVAGGVIFLLDNFNIIEFGEIFWTVIFGIAGLAFISVFIASRANWWALIPGVILLAIGLLIYVNLAFPTVGSQWGGSIVLGGISLAFLLVYLANRENWWAIIPFGVLGTLAVVAGIGDSVSGFDIGGIFFLGLGFTFALVGVLPNPAGSTRWAFIPAGILIVIGILILAALSSIINFIWPIALILCGVIILLRTLRNREV